MGRITLIISLFLFVKGFATHLVTEDFRKAQTLSKDYQLPMALLFTGSDWSEESQAILEQWHEKAEALGRDMVLTWIDFPQLNTMDSDRVQLDFSLKESFHINSFPTLILLDVAGEEIARLGFPLEEDLGAILKQKLSIYRDVSKDWKQAKETKDETLMLSCYKRLQMLSCEAFKQQIITYAAEHQLCPELLFESYVSLVNAGKLREAQMLRPHLKRDFHLTLFDFQQEKNAPPIDEYLKTHQIKDDEHVIEQISMMSSSKYP